MSKKATPATSATSDSSDSYWLACIAHNTLNSQPAKQQSSTMAPGNPSEATAIPERPVSKRYPRNPADSFWLKQAGTQRQNSTAARVSEEDLSIPQGDARVSVPPHIICTAIIDDGKTHHVAWGIRNMSLSGVLLDMEISHLREGMTVDLLLRFTLKSRAVDRRIPTKVVRIQKNALALQFSHYDTPTCHDLVGLLYSA